MKLLRGLEALIVGDDYNWEISLSFVLFNDTRIMVSGRMFGVIYDHTFFHACTSSKQTSGYALWAISLVTVDDHLHFLHGFEL